jgi:hypothetical protein
LPCSFVVHLGALSKYFPNVKTFVRAHDVDHGVNLEKAGASAVSKCHKALKIFFVDEILWRQLV